MPLQTPMQPCSCWQRTPQIDASRIAILGFSFGGEVAHLTALEPLRAALRFGQGHFAAHVAFYPAGVFGAIPAPSAYTGAPMLMLLGKLDDNLPVAKIDDYLAYARAAGTSPPIEVVTYKGAHHASTVTSLGQLRFYPEYVSTKKCPLILLGSNRPAFLVMAKRLLSTRVRSVHAWPRHQGTPWRTMRR